MKVVVPKELLSSELRVAATPKTTTRLIKQGFEVFVQSGAGAKAKYSDEEYLASGAQIIENAQELYTIAEIVLKVQPLTEQEISMLKPDVVVLSYLWPAQNQELLKKLAEARINSIAMDAIPRISRAQKMDVLSSMANIAGYRAVIESANHFGRFLNGQITAAGKVEPAKVLVIGAGVAGLAAIGTAKSLGAIVRAFDTRKEVAEQIQSMGAQFISVEIDEDGSTASGYSKEMSKAFIDAEMALFKKQATEVDIIITTAQIPGKEAPKLILEDHVKAMKPGSVIVDLAAQSGGNCVLTKKNEVYTTENGVIIVGIIDQLPTQASYLYGNNLCNLLDDMGKAANFKIDMNDDVVKRAMVTYDGKINWPPEPLSVSVQKPKESKKLTPEEEASLKSRKTKKIIVSNIIWLSIIGISLYFLGKVAPPDFMGHITAFVLAVFTGWNLIWNVTHALHTPLMSVTNAISGIIITGGLLLINDDMSSPVTIMSFIAILIASINIVGGFVVTYRMLNMFKK